MSLLRATARCALCRRRRCLAHADAKYLSFSSDYIPSKFSCIESKDLPQVDKDDHQGQGTSVGEVLKEQQEVELVTN